MGDLIFFYADVAADIGYIQELFFWGVFFVVGIPSYLLCAGISVDIVGVQNLLMLGIYEMVGMILVWFYARVGANIGRILMLLEERQDGENDIRKGGEGS